MGTVEQDLRQYERENADDAAHEDAVLSVLESWEHIVFWDPAADCACFLIYETIRSDISTIDFQTGYSTLSAAQCACEDRVAELAQSRVSSAISDYDA